MKTTFTKALNLAAIAFLALPVLASAADTFEMSFSSGYTGSVDMLLTGFDQGNGSWLINSATGTFDGLNVLGVALGNDGADNLLLPHSTPPVTFGGLTVLVDGNFDGGNWANIFGANGQLNVQGANLTADGNQYVTILNDPINPVPEPAAFGVMGVGLLGLATRRKK